MGRSETALVDAAIPRSPHYNLGSQLWNLSARARDDRVFFRKVDVSTSDIGTLGALISVGTLALSPVYGWLLDRFGGFVPIAMASFFCAVGCAIRGVAWDVSILYIGSFLVSLGAGNLWTIVLSYLSKYSRREKRSTVVSAFLFQVATLRLLGKCLYAPFDMSLLSVFGVEDDLFRDRITMSVCTVFCFFGIFLLLFMPAGVNNVELCDTAAAINMEFGAENSQSPTIPVPPDGNSPAASKTQATISQWPFVILSAVLFLQAASLTGTETLWPIVLKDGGDFGND